ncbi:hypothetical protein CAI21_10435 [Alkalilimnicola ehrlichii]|uniref:N-acetyltransferase domain-containing protein n=1 Tax=Alkalilimnicola ehrlichii TaxID=351052 RepID=A0A3E0WUN0_9GAMM|nr:GNAT family N-acetyltransferase [Alkalilimnicola ehrlichii]RFA29177.1 hypothetical protein CAI21_10435 [Alkalilimnicola ehrlichii]RFA36089.1 hypothetical protein CAL65_11580 [Alkalilimnicola ehrlichii]
MSNNMSPILRQLYWPEKEALRAHLLRLGPEERRGRFAWAANDAFINRYIDNLEWTLSTYRAIGAFVDGELRGVAECRISRNDWRWDAELAFSVESAYQRQGIGSELFRRMVAMARNRGLNKISIMTESHNKAMHALARRNGMRLIAGPEVEGHMELEGPTPLSVAEEMIGESTAWWYTGLSFLSQQLSDPKEETAEA